MKKRYQIDREQAVRQFHKQAEESGQDLQLHLPLKEVAAALQQGVGELMRQAGLDLMQLIMDNEVRQLAGEHYQRAKPSSPTAGAARKASSSWLDRRSPCSVRGCAATTVTNNPWAAMNCSAAASRSTTPFGTNSCWGSRRGITPKPCGSLPPPRASKSRR